LSIYCTDWWGHEARWLQALRGMVPARLAVFDPIVGDWSRKRVLDLGCGGGFMAEAMAARGATVTGIDPATAAIDAARLHSGASGVAIDYLVASGEALPFAAATFDVVVCVDVLEHIEAWDLVVAEVRRVLRPRGLFLFDTINRNPLAAFVIVTIGENVIRLLPTGPMTRPCSSGQPSSSGPSN
jgi:2-polyprenyl-6-hydroxyphenyl methylase/3-demethylubiquinone-9 3-methyltransferase